MGSQDVLPLNLIALPQGGRLRYESIAVLALSERIHADVEQQDGRTKPSPQGEGAPKGRRLDGESGISVSMPSPRGEGGERSEPDRALAV